MQQTGASGLAKKKKFKFKSFMDLRETNQSLGLASAGSAAQVIPTSPEILSAVIPEGRSEERRVGKECLNIARKKKNS